jgi:hypothetical protein
VRVCDQVLSGVAARETTARPLLHTRHATDTACSHRMHGGSLAGAWLVRTRGVHWRLTGRPALVRLADADRRRHRAGHDALVLSHGRRHRVYSSERALRSRAYGIRDWTSPRPSRAWPLGNRSRRPGHPGVGAHRRRSYRFIHRPRVEPERMPGRQRPMRAVRGLRRRRARWICQRSRIRRRVSLARARANDAAPIRAARIYAAATRHLRPHARERIHSFTDVGRWSARVEPGSCRRVLMSVRWCRLPRRFVRKREPRHHDRVSVRSEAGDVNRGLVSRRHLNVQRGPIASACGRFGRVTPRGGADLSRLRDRALGSSVDVTYARVLFEFRAHNPCG